MTDAMIGVGAIATPGHGKRRAAVAPRSSSGTASAQKMPSPFQ